MTEKASQIGLKMTFNELSNLVGIMQGLDIHTDSRKIQTGDVFVAITGTIQDGHDFIDQALEKGAGFIVCSQNHPISHKQTTNEKIITVEDTAKAAAQLAQTRNGSPATKLINLAVTGTNGKTTVGFLVRSCFQQASEKCGLIGTITYDTGATSDESTLTTPDSLAIADMQAKMVRAGAKYMMIEASSHALSQQRLWGIDFKAAAFTNLTGDHLDYHLTKEQYLAAKAILFQQLSTDATAVLNRESPEATEIEAKTNANILFYAIDNPADIRAHIESMNTSGTTFDLEYQGQRQKVTTPLLGKHNVSNHLAAAGLCLAAGLDLKTIAAGLSALASIPGRLEKIDSDAPFAVLIDYAHTDDALQNVLITLRPLAQNNLTVVFGCGGDRDRTKRPRMAAAAQKLADSVIVTSDNPRTEEPKAIIDEIMTGFDNTGYTEITVEPDRKKAIELAVTNAKKDDIILLAGKGHETYQIIGTEKKHFCDKETALESLKKRRC
ncbi:MAG: UDP-N-acetylmuramoyl-L-alanyl-D-glutamate--2,6-diaminopimelate ligase [Planctomycetota bacterium]|jgi:UDP-N-acetylmuramoyl-L-alanyl-D-glutamate--2,6-diaminopimelate ligase